MKTNKPFIVCDITTYPTQYRKYKRTLIYYPSNSKKGIAIKGTNVRVSFEYVKQ